MEARLRQRKAQYKAPPAGHFLDPARLRRRLLARQHERRAAACARALHAAAATDEAPADDEATAAAAAAAGTTEDAPEIGAGAPAAAAAVVSPRLSAAGAAARRHAQQLQQPCWMTVPPADLNGAWLVLPRPAGVRCCVTAGHGGTSVRDRHGRLLFPRCRTGLPGGGEGGGSSRGATVLDCVYAGGGSGGGGCGAGTFAVLDLLQWNGEPAVGWPAEMRRFWLQQHLAPLLPLALPAASPLLEEGQRPAAAASCSDAEGSGRLSPAGRAAFVLVDAFECDTSGLSAAYAAVCDAQASGAARGSMLAGGLEGDGLLFCHKEWHYETGCGGATPFVLRWTDAASSAMHRAWEAGLVSPPAPAPAAAAAAADAASAAGGWVLALPAPAPAAALAGLAAAASSYDAGVAGSRCSSSSDVGDGSGDRASGWTWFPPFSAVLEALSDGALVSADEGAAPLATLTAAHVAEYGLRPGDLVHVAVLPANAAAAAAAEPSSDAGPLRAGRESGGLGTPPVPEGSMGMGLDGSSDDEEEEEEEAGEGTCRRGTVAGGERGRGAATTSASAGAVAAVSSPSAAPFRVAVLGRFPAVPPSPRPPSERERTLQLALQPRFHPHSLSRIAFEAMARAGRAPGIAEVAAAVARAM